MKKYLVSIIIALGILASVTPTKAEENVTPWKYDNLYARCCAIVDIEYGEDGINLIIIEDCNGYQFSYYDDADDLLIGDAMSCIFDDNGTEEVTDDIVVAARYDRPDLLPLI